MATAIPVLMITGWLGAGKTTFLNRLLQLPAIREQRVALIINEFGTLGVDAQLIRAGDYPVFELNRGSVFCVCLRTDLVRTLTAVAGDLRPDLVIVEATGIAEPRDLNAVLADRALAARFTMRANVCLVDARDFIKVAAMLKAARRQAQWADGLVINKTDLVVPADVDQLERVLADLNPAAPRTRTTHGQVDWGFVAGLAHLPRVGGPLHEPPAALCAVSLTTDRTVDTAAFRAAVAGLGDRLLRLKGQVDFGAGPIFVEVVNGRRLEPTARQLKAPGTAFTAIAWRLPAAQVRAVFESAWQASG